MEQENERLEIEQEWKKARWYSVSDIAVKMARTAKTVSNWREIGIKRGKKKVYLKMVKRPCHWYARGQWIIDFLTCPD
jgi:hypothetical protein